MAKDINLTSKKWNDIVFEDRPKDYGAYEIRLSSSRRHLVAFFCIILIVAFVAMLPKLIETVRSLRPAPVNITEDTTLANIAALEEIEEQNEIIQQVQAVELPPLRSTIQFVVPEIVDDTEVTEDNQVKTNEEVMDSNEQVGVFDVEGTDDELGVDLADLIEHQVVAGVVQEEILDIVQQKASFPGGMSAMYDYVGRELKYPQNLADSGIGGTVTVKFAVMSNGTIDQVTAVSSPDPQLSAEAVRVIKSMPKWLPAMNNGKVVASYFFLPVVFETR